MESDRKFWNVSRETADFLYEQAMVPEVRKVLEIGTSNGYSGTFFARALSHKKGLLYTVESHKGRFEEARKNFEREGLGDFVRQIFGHAPEVFWREGGGDGGREDGRGEGAETGAESSPRLANQIGRGLLAEERDFDLVFLDGTKMEYASYLEEILPRVRSGGLIVADNCISHRTEMRDFFIMLEGLEEEGKVKLELLKMDGGLMLIRKE